MLKGKHILLGITGSIAAYKAAIVVRMLIKEGAEVKVIMTPLANEFITPLTLATLSKNPILVDFFNPENGQWNSHVDLGIWSDIYLVAPASANTIAKMANGVADNLLLTTYLSARCPVVIAPAMDLDMLKHPATLKNLEVLKSRGNMIVEPASGELASGLEGKGRMEEPEKIVAFINNYFSAKQELKNKKILVTAGPTVEAIDPVRYISNHSSGKMGYAIADAFANRGAEVILVSGPVNISANNPNIKVVKVTSAKEMHEVCLAQFGKCNAAIMCAAVADYTPLKASQSKIKRTQEKLSIELMPNPDIAADLGKLKKNNQLLAGFALETNNEIANAKQKLAKKNLDFIVLNSLSGQTVFNSDYNKVTIIDKDNNIQQFELKDKLSVASDIADKVVEWFNKKAKNKVK
jgi:phosphopantothenoylcysteine decarboxylase/phosphopantothenate--cysteine ligase